MEDTEYKKLTLASKLYRLGADLDLIAEATGLDKGKLATIFTQLMLNPEITKKGVGMVDGVRVTFEINIPGAKKPPTFKERIIDTVLKFHDVAPDFKPAIRERAINTFNGFQGTPEEKALQAIIHAYTELTVGDSTPPC